MYCDLEAQRSSYRAREKVEGRKERRKERRKDASLSREEHADRGASRVRIPDPSRAPVVDG